MTARQRWRRLYIPARRFVRVYAPEILGVVGAVVVTAATWQLHPIAGLYVAGVAALTAGVLIAMGRRPGG